MKKLYIYSVILLITATSLTACKKDFLDTKPDKSLLIPQTTADMRALLDNNFVFNRTPGLLTLADGDLVTTDAGFNGYFLDEERKTYTWAADIFGANTSSEWNIPYQQIFYANVILEQLDKISPDGTVSDTKERQEIKGAALFHRAFCFYQLAQQFAAPYSAANAATDPGIPLKLTAAVTDRAARGTVEQTYRQIIADLKTARQLLPVSTTVKSRPGLPAVYAMLAKTYLEMENYSLAGLYADSCLQLRNTLINYNTLSTTATRPFPKVLPNGNDEVFFYALTVDYDFTGNNAPTVVDPVLYSSYRVNDLRKVVFFRSLAPGFKFKGNYAGILSMFSGLATDEMLLVRAEASARAGNLSASLSDLNRLLVTRWKAGTYIPLTAADGEAVLRLILTERRKELVGRNTRWSDLRRLNKDSRFAVTLNRTILGANYSLEPNSKRFVYPIPADEIVLNGLAQNER